MSDISEYVNRILSGDSLFKLRELPAKSIHCCVTSPPYYALRSYAGIAPTQWPAMKYSIFGFEVEVPEMICELGHESDPKYFIGHIVLIFREVWRVLRDDGTIWVNMGDSYASIAGGYDNTGSRGSSAKISKATQGAVVKGRERKPPVGLKPKDMIGIPWMMAFALRDDGWFLRSDIIWAKKNTMPESVTDRPTKSHEYIFLLSKSQKYYYDAEAIKTPAAESSKQRWDQDVLAQTQSARVPGKTNGNMKAVGGPMKDLPEGQTNRKARDKQRGHSRRHAGFNDRWDSMTTAEQSSMGANKRTVWHMATNSFKDAHFATFPEELITDPIKAGTSEKGCCGGCGAPYLRLLERELVPGHKAAKTFIVDQRDADADKQDQGSNRQKDGHKPGWIYQGTTTGWKASCKCEAGIVPCRVLDPFSGAGTTAMVAAKLNRDFVAIEISKDYVPMSEKRINTELGMFSPLK